MSTLTAYANDLLLQAAHEVGSLPGVVQFTPADHPFLQRLGNAHTAARHDPMHPEVAASYRAFITETETQFLAVASRIDVEPWPIARGPQPYRTSQELHDDLRCWHLYFFTEADLPPCHPLAAYSPFVIDGFALQWNHVFRVTHDALGHGIYGTGFGPVGEWRAFVTHAQLYPATALLALACETLMQTAAFYFGPFSNLPRTARPYPEQKSYLPPIEASQVPHLAAASSDDPQIR